MKRLFISLLLVLCLLAVPVQGQELQEGNITMEDIVKANSKDVLLEKYGSVLVEMNEEYEMYDSIYLSDDICFVQLKPYAFMVDADDNWIYTDVEGEDTLVYQWFVMNEEEKKEEARTLDDYPDVVTDSTFTPLEEIENMEENDDGTLTVITRFHSEDAEEGALKGYLSEYPEEYGTYDLKMVYTLDQESLEILSCESYLLAPDQDILLLAGVVTYHAEQPEVLKTMIDLADEFRNGEKENPRTITVIYDCGTDDEETYEITVDPQIMIQPIFKTGYDYLYDDPEKTMPYTGGDGVGDWTIYAFAEGQ